MDFITLERVRGNKSFFLMASCSGSQVVPATIGGYGRNFQYKDLQSRGGLVDLAFSTRTPPDIKPNSRIIAICGVADYIVESEEELPSSSEDEMPSSPTTSSRKSGLGNLISKTAMLLSKSKMIKRKGPVQQQGCASPLEDGWFFSDCFMFYRLFDGLGRWTKILCRVSGNWLSLMFEQEQANAGSCANLLEIWSKSTELTVTAKEQRITA